MKNDVKDQNLRGGSEKSWSAIAALLRVSYLIYIKNTVLNLCNTAVQVEIES